VVSADLVRGLGEVFVEPLGVLRDVEPLPPLPGTPQGNLSKGMRWLQASFALRFNSFRITYLFP
jgi:hypothetical protein